jgi:DNA polymerase sigma
MIMGSNVEVFGSYATELGLPESDIDLVVHCPNI